MNDTQPWDIYYRGYIGKWTDLFKKEDEAKINSVIFKTYLETKCKLASLIKELNDLERKSAECYPLLKSIPTSSNTKENETFVKEIIVYINSKQT